MNIAAVLSENEPFSVKGGANARKASEIFRRFSTAHQIVLFSPAASATAFDGAALIHKRVLCSLLRRNFKYFYPHEISFRLRNRFDAIYVFNRPEFIPTLQKRNPAAKLILHMGNDHLMEMDVAAGRRIVDACDLIIGVSGYTCAGILQKYPHAGGKLRHFPNGVNTRQFCPDPAPPKKTELTVLYLGRLCAGKGVHLLISAMLPLFSKFPALRLKIVGSTWFARHVVNEYVQQLQALARPAGDRIEFVGYVPNDRVAEHYRQADIFVAPSLWNEGFCNTNLEAMASGLPVISSHRGGIPEVVGDAGILFDPDQPGALAASLEYLLSNHAARTNLAQAARQRAATHFDWDQISHQIEDAVTNLITPARPSDSPK